MNCEIRRSHKGPYYEMYIDGKFYGTYDTVAEAAMDFDRLSKERMESA